MYRHAKILFSVAALFNFSLGLSWLLAWPMLQNVLQLAPADGSNRMILNLCAVLVLTFGYAYYLVGRNPDKFRPYVMLGIVGKLSVVAVALPVLVSGSQGYLLALSLMVDLVFAILFVHFLLKHPAYN